MNFEKHHRREPSEPQLATMIDVFSILIIFLIAGTAMDNSILNIPDDLFLPSTQSNSTSLNAPQITLKEGVVDVNFIGEKFSLKEISQIDESENIKKIKNKLSEYISKNTSSKKKSLADTQLLQSINLVSDKNTSYADIYLTIKIFRSFGFQNTILVGLDGSGKK
jgi:biopolymer transport protein ExbD